MKRLIRRLWNALFSQQPLTPDQIMQLLKLKEPLL